MTSSATAEAARVYDGLGGKVARLVAGESA